MARTNGLLVLFALLIGLVIGGWIVYKFKPLPEGKVIANQTAIDSLNAFIQFADSVRNLPMEPVVTTTDTIYVQIPVEVTVPHIPEPEKIDSSTVRFRDSLVIDREINAWVDIMVQGEVQKLEVFWNYRPVIRTIETTTELPVYKPIITSIKIPKYVTGHYVSAIGGGNSKLFTFGIDYDLVKYNRIYGFQYRRYGDQNVYSLKIGINLSTLFKFKR